MEDNQDHSLTNKQLLYGVWGAAMQSNDVEQMKASADQLRKQAENDPSLQPKIDELDAAIAKLSGEDK